MALQDKISDARQNGHSDSEIYQYLKQHAVNSGWKGDDNEFNDYLSKQGVKLDLGTKQTPTQKPVQKVKQDTQQAQVPDIKTSPSGQANEVPIQAETTEHPVLDKMIAASQKPVVNMPQISSDVQQQNPKTAIAYGVTKGIMDMITPANAAMIVALTKSPAFLQKVAGLYFAYQGGKGMVQAGPETVKAFEEKRWADVGEGFTKEVLGSLMVLGGVTPFIPKLKESGVSVGEDVKSENIPSNDPLKGNEKSQGFTQTQQTPNVQSNEYLRGIFEQLSKQTDEIRNTNTEPVRPNKPTQTTATDFGEKVRQAIESANVNKSASEPKIKELEVKLEDTKQGNESVKYGEQLRSFFAGNRDVRIAETNQLREELKGKLSLDEQEALTLYRDFKDNPRGLMDLLKDPYFKDWNNIVKKAIAPSETMLDADKRITDFVSRIDMEERKLGVMDSSIPPEKYITHLLAPAEETGKLGMIGRSKIGRTDPFSRGRFYETVADAKRAGVKIRSLNALDALTIRGEKWGISTSTKMLLGHLKDSELGKFGTSGAENIPNDWIPLDPSNRFFRNTIAFTDKETGNPSAAHQDLYVAPKVAEAMKPILDSDFTGTLPGFRKSRLYQGYMKSLQLGLSMFHLRALNITALGNEGLNGFIRSYASDMKSQNFLDEEKDFIQHAGTTSILGRTVEAYRGLEMTSIPSREKLLRNAPGIKQADAFAKLITKLTFDIVQRKFKVSDYAMKKAEWIAKNPNATDVEFSAAKLSVAKEVNAAYGGLNWEVMGVNKGTLNIVRFLMLAPDWTFSNFFNAKYSFEGGPAGAASRKFWARSMITGMVLSYAMSSFLNNKLETPDSNNLFSVHYGKDKNGRDIYQNIFFAGAPQDAIMLTKNVMNYGIIEGFAQSIANKASPILRASFHLFTNRNYLGQQEIPKGMGPLAGTMRSLMISGEDMGPLPFSLQSIGQMFMDPKKQYSYWEYASSLMGTIPKHVVPEGKRVVPSGKKKGELAPAKERTELPFFQQVLTGKRYKPAGKTDQWGVAE